MSPDPFLSLPFLSLPFLSLPFCPFLFVPFCPRFIPAHPDTFMRFSDAAADRHQFRPALRRIHVIDPARMQSAPLVRPFPTLLAYSDRKGALG